MAGLSGRLAAGAAVVMAVGAVLWVFSDRSTPADPPSPSAVAAAQSTARPTASATTPLASTPEPPAPDAAPANTSPEPASAADFNARLAAAEGGDIDAAYEVGLTVLLCIQSASTIREAAVEGLSLPPVDLSQYDCDDVPDDAQLAGRLLRQAADEGHVDAAREYAMAAVMLTPLESTQGLRNLTQSDLVTLAASEYRALDYLEFAATSGDLTAAKHLAARLARGFAVPTRDDAGGAMQLRAGDPAQALAWFYALRIAGDEPWMQAWGESLRGKLEPQEIMQAQAQGQDYYYSYLADAP